MAVLISQNRRLLFILVKAQLYQPRQTAVFLYAARQGDETMFYYISNYLISQFNYMNYKREFEKDEYKIRFYIPMVARMLLVKSVVTPDFSSRKAKDEVQKIISIIKEKQEDLTQAFKKAVEITEKAIAIFKGENPKMTIDKILRSQKFNQLVKEQTADYLKIGNY